MEMELIAMRARLQILEAGLMAMLRMHPEPDDAMREIDDAAERQLMALGERGCAPKPADGVVMTAVREQVTELSAALA